MKFSRTIHVLCLFLVSTVSLHADSWQMTTLGIAAGESQALALRSDGSVWTWGTNHVGEMGISNVTGSCFPLRIPSLTNVTGIAAGWQHSLAVENNGTVWAWGDNRSGQLGKNNATNSLVPVQVTGVTNATKVAGGKDFSLALLANGQVMAWGTNNVCQLGTNGLTVAYQPILVAGLSNVVKVVAGGEHSVALDASGVVWCWGYGFWGEIGNGQVFNVAPAVSVLSNVVDVAAGNDHVIALKSNGTVWAWGDNQYYELGNPNDVFDEFPIPVGLTGVSAIGAGFLQSGATLTNGQNYMWGCEYAGPGVPLFNTWLLAPPVTLSPAAPFVKYAFGMSSQGQNFSLGMAANGTVWAWDDNEYGQFGNGNTMSPFNGNLELLPTESFAPVPPARWGEFLRGDTSELTTTVTNDLDFCSIVVPIDLEQGVALNATGSDAYCYSNSPPWFLSISNQTVYVSSSLSGPVVPVNNPETAFGSQGGGSSLFPNQPYRFGVYAGGFDESTPAATNVIRISVYNATNFMAGATNVAPFSVFTISLPRRTVSADSNLWTAFMSNGASVTFATNGLTTTVQFLDNGLTNGAGPVFGLGWLNGHVITNYILTGYELTHIASSTNYFYKVEVLGKVQTGNTSLQYFATNSSGAWAYTPLYTLDFNQPSALQSVYMNRLFFQGTPTPPTYADASVVGPAGVSLAITNQYALTNAAYTNLDNSPELRRHPVLDQFVLDMNKDPLALASYVINQIELTDPYAAGQANSGILPVVTCGGIDRSALTTFLEGRGSPVEQCALLVYLLRQAGYPAAYVFPTNNNLFMSANHVSQLWEMQVSGVLNPNGVPMIANSLLSMNYPWVVAKIGTNTVHVFPWLKDHEIVEGVNLYDYMPTNYSTALQWVEQYVRGNTNILNLDSKNVVSTLFPEFVQQYLGPLGPSFSMDNLGVRAFNRQHQFPGWAYLPQPDVVTNLSTLTVVDNLQDRTNFTFLTNIFNTVRVQVYNNSVSGTPVLDSGTWDSCDLGDRKFLLFTDNGRLALWLAPYRTNVTAIQSFTGPSSTALQSNSVTFGSLSYLAVQIVHHRQVASLTSPYAYFPLTEVVGSTNLSHCNLGDIAGIALDYGRVSPLMLQQHEETYWGLERQRAANTNLIPKVWDYAGTAAYLLGMGYFQKYDVFDANNQQWHKLRDMINFESGLGVIGATGNATNIQAKVDMITTSELLIGNASLHLNDGVPNYSAVENYTTLAIAAMSAQEHDEIQSMFPDQNAVSTVRLLQMAQQQATNGNAPILELYNNTYAAAGNQTNSGYGSTLLKNKDTNIWASVTSAFAQAGGAYTRVLITPAKMTNSPKTYIGMGALIFGKAMYQALISVNGAVLNGGWGSEQPGFGVTTTEPTLAWSLGVDTYYDPTFTYNISTPGYTYTPVFSPVDTAGLSQDTFGYTPEQWAQSWQVSTLDGQNNSSPLFGLTTGGDTGSFGQTDAGQRSFLQTIAEPVNVTSGEFYEDTADLSLPGPLPLQLRRNYTSANLQANQLGYGWKMNFTPFLVVASNVIYAAELDGTVLAYRLTNSVWQVLPQDNPSLNNNSIYGIGSTANLFNSVLTTNSGTNYLITSPDGSLRTYQVMLFPVTSGTNTISRTRPYLTKWQDAAGNYALFYYGTNSTSDDWGQLNRINMANGNTLVFKYDFYGRVTQVMTGDGRFVYYQYDSYGDLVTVTLPDLSQEQFQYQHYTFTTNNNTYTDSTHLILQDIKPSGRIVVNAYDSLRRVVTQAATVGASLVLYTNAYFYYTNNVTSLTNQFASGATRVDDFFHNPTVYYYTNNLITNTVDPLGAALQQVWFPDGATNLPGYYPRSLQYSVDKRGLTTQFYYDSFGNVTQKVLIGNLTGEGIANQTATNTSSYTTNNLPSLIQDPVGNGMQFTYDSADPFRVLQSVRVCGIIPAATNYYSYTNIAQVSSLGTTNFAFGVCWQKVEGGATNVYRFNGNGFLTQSTSYPATQDNPTDTDPAIVHYLSYNLRGQMYQDQTAGGGIVQLDFDPMGRVISKDVFDQYSNNVSSEFNYYNRNGELEWYYGTRSNPQDYVYNIYDGAGRNIQQIRSRSQARSDGTGVEAPAGAAGYATTFQTFDGFGNLTSVTDPRGVVTTNWFDPLGRVVCRQVLETNGTVLKTEQFAYENGGQVTLATNALGGVAQMLYTQTGKPYFTSAPDGATNSTTYYLDGRVKCQYLANGSYSTNAYDDVHLLIARTFYSATGAALATNVTGLDRRGNSILTVDAAGNAFTNTYDGLNRLKMTVGPAISSVIQTSGSNPGGPFTYSTNVLQHFRVNYFDAAGLARSSVNALGETNAATMDVLGRPTSALVYGASGALVREKYFAYSGDHNSITVTDGSGANAISHTTWTDDDGHTVLSIAYPSSGVNDFTLNRYDVAGNLISSQHETSANGSIVNWTTTGLSYDGLHRVTQKVDRDNAATTYAYDPLNDVTNRVMPGGNLSYAAIYNSAGQILSEWSTSSGSFARSNNYSYFASGSPFAGLLQTRSDGRGVSCAYFYDSWLRATNFAYTGALAEQNLTTTLQYEPRGFITNIIEQFTGTNTIPAVSVQRSYDVYSQLASESVNDGSFGYGDSQTWDADGRRTQLNLGAANYGFGWQADGRLIAANDSTGGGVYGYSTAGLLTSRAVGNRQTAIASRDGEGRPLSINTTINAVMPELNETNVWSGDGLLLSHTLWRGDFGADNRAYAYASGSRRLTQEQLNLSASTTWTNTFAYDNGAASGPGVLTSAAQWGGGSASWSGVSGAFSRVSASTNTLISLSAYGHTIGLVTLSGWLDNQPVAVTGVASSYSSMAWRAPLQLTPGTHQLTVAAQMQNGLYTVYTTNVFTNTASYQAATDYYDAAGNITNRIWLNPSGGIDRVQTLSWDARGRLHAVTERDANTNGYNWTATYDGFNRRLSTTSVLVSNGVAFASSPIAINSYFDPQAEFLELGVNYGSATEFKLYGPDLNGVYGGLNGVGGLDAVSPILNLFWPTISDERGNILGVETNGAAVSWNPARPTGYSSVPGYQPLPLANGANISLASAWRGRWGDITGLYNIGLRPYDPMSGRWLTFDSIWNEVDPNGMTFCGGDPINGFDPDGRLSASVYNETALDTSSLFSSTMWGGMGSTTYSLGARTVTGIAQASEIGSDMIGSSSAGLYDWAFGTDVQAYYQGYSQFYQNIYNNPSSGPSSGQILAGTANTELNIATLGLYNMGQGIGTAAATGDYTQLQDASLSSLLLTTGTRTMQAQDISQLSVGYVPNAADQALISYFSGGGTASADNALPSSVASSFANGQYQPWVATEDTILYRAEAEGQGVGSFFGTQAPADSLDAEIMYNITKWGNNATTLSTYQIPAGTTGFIGPVEGGSGVQIFIPGAPTMPGVQLINQTSLFISELKYISSP
jgi:RHS repeat-associated protein